SHRTYVSYTTYSSHDTWRRSAVPPARDTYQENPMNRREVISAATAAGLAAVAAAQDKDGPIKARDPLKITKLETFLVQPRWLFLKVHTNAGIVGLGEPLVEGRALTVQTAVKEIEPYLVGKDPRQVVHHWQAIYRHAF